MKSKQRRILAWGGVAAMVAVVAIVLSMPVLAAGLSGSAGDPSGGSAKVYSESKAVVLTPGSSVLIYVSCTVSSCSPATYHSAAVTLTVVVESFAASTPLINLTYWFGNPTCGLPHTCPNKILTVTDYTQGPTTLQYDAYATEITNYQTSGNQTVAFSYTAVYESDGN